MARIIKIPNLDNFIQRYASGESENTLAKELGISRGAFRFKLNGNGVHVRSQSEAETVKWARMTPEQRLRQIAPYHEAIRGRERSIEDLHARALTRQASCSQASPAEAEVLVMLEPYSFSITRQMAVGPYNIDLAIHVPSIAVEVMGHSDKRATQSAIGSSYGKRSPYLLDQGWNVVIIVIDGLRNRLTNGAAEYIATFAEELRRNPSPIGQYRVIRGNGKLKTFLSREYQHGTRVGRTERGLKPNKAD